MKNCQSGFTLIELVVTVSITITLFGIVGLNLAQTQRNTNVGSIKDVLISDLMSQQTKAMLGIGSTSGTNYGIYFEPNKYTLFQGSTYVSSDTKNYIVNIDNGYLISNIQFPGNAIIFSSATGTVSGFLNGNSSVSIQDEDGIKIRTITINRYGVVIGDN